MKKKNHVFDRMLGAMYGVAVGDALGGPVEFMSAGAIEKQHGRVTEMIGGGWMDLSPGETTDDTAMTMAVARGIAENPEDPVPAIGKNFIEWYNSRPKDIGATCAMAIATAINSNAETKEDWLKAGHETDRKLAGMSAGNGALMRTIYPAIYYARPRERFVKTREIGAMTHYNAISAKICSRYAEAVYDALFGVDPAIAIKRMEFTRGTAPTGYVVYSWNNAAEAILDNHTFEDTVIDAVNRGGDADTIGAIAGGLAGAYYGYENIPQRWIDCLDKALCEEIDNIVTIAYNANKDYYGGRFLWDI